ncbi:MAG: L,D-transpeptidase family protein [Pseudomonadota bacterium]
MERSEQLIVLAAGLAGILAGVVTLLALDEPGPSVASIAAEPRLRPTIPLAASPTGPPAVDRLAFVTRDGVSQLLPTVTDDTAESEVAESEDAEAWETETRAVPASRSPATRVLSFAPQGPASAPSAPRDQTLAARLAELSPTATERLAERFRAAEAAWPPSEIALVAIKDERSLELFARQAGGAWRFVHRYKVLAASGTTGPKLRRGDKQVPEGVYGISFLNPNSRYHVSMRVNYPNAFDRQMASLDGRKDLGGDIMIHGKASSAGCLAIGDEAAEELFVLSAQTGLPNVKLVIAPTDFRRKKPASVAAADPPWLPKLYTEVASAMTDLKAPQSFSLLSFLGY